MSGRCTAVGMTRADALLKLTKNLTTDPDGPDVLAGQ